MDDVSPVKILLSVNKDIHWSEWIINDSLLYHPNEEKFIEHIFRYEGVSNIKLNASGIDGEKYIGNLNIRIPQIANKLIIYGYYFKDEYEFNIIDDTLSFNFDYYNGTHYSYSKALISKDKFENSDSVIFDSPVVINISGFENMEGNNLFINFIIKGKNTYSDYFRINFFIKEWYYHHRMYAPNYIYLENLIGENNEMIYLIADWAK